MSQRRASLPLCNLDTIDDDLKAGWSIPASWYFDPDHFDFEMEHIFAKRWLFLAPIQKLANPGDTVIGTAGNIPVLVVRGADGVLRGFINICRHRGYAVARESKCNRLLVCRYHAWTYNLDGTLRGAPHAESDPTFNKAEMSLLPISVDTWGTGVFVNADPHAAPFRSAHPQLTGFADSVGYRTDSEYYLENYEIIREITYDFNANWKLWYDNNTECYHCPTIHPGSFSAAFDVGKEDFSYAEIDQFMTFSFKPTKRPIPEGKLRAQWQRAFQLFPGIGITAQDDILLAYQATPVGAEETRKVMYCLKRKSADRKIADEWIDLWHQTFTEDQEATKIQQKGLRSGTLLRGRYVLDQEGPLLFVNRLIIDAYRQALTTT